MREKSLWSEISQRAFDRAIERINKVSASKWDICYDVEPDDNYDAICCYFQVKDPEREMSFAMFFRRDDLPHISKAFVGYGFFLSQKISRSEELLVEELSNIILNSIVSEISNILKEKIIPIGPKTVHAPKDTAMEVLSSALPENKSKVSLRSLIGFNFGDKKVSCEVYSFMPEVLASKLASL